MAASRAHMPAWRTAALVLLAAARAEQDDARAARLRRYACGIADLAYWRNAGYDADMNIKVF